MDAPGGSASRGVPFEDKREARPAKVGPAGSRVECLGRFDNSPANPNPLQEVRWGDQSWEEMMLASIGYLDVARPVGDGGTAKNRQE